MSRDRPSAEGKGNASWRRGGTSCVCVICGELAKHGSLCKLKSLDGVYRCAKGLFLRMVFQNSSLLFSTVC